MKKEYAIECVDVSKVYTLKTKGIKQKFYAINNVSFSVEKGSVVGILGTNGSGKSTLSMLLAGISLPDSGNLIINGEQSLVSINAGLNKQLTGYENILLKGAMLGLSKKQIHSIVDGVIQFAELGDFLYQPVKKYSSGMKSRLGFSINLCLDPDIMIIDEALSVGDKAFSTKCMEKILELKNSGKTIIFVSHSLAQIKKFCDVGLWIEGGVLKDFGDMLLVSNNYQEYIDELNKLSNKEKKIRNDELFNKRLVK